jgi:hypothetical protein
VRDYDLLIPASVEALAEGRHAGDRERYLAAAADWREQYIAEHGVKPPETTRPMPGARPSSEAPSAGGRSNAAG